MSSSPESGHFASQGHGHPRRGLVGAADYVVEHDAGADEGLTGEPQRLMLNIEGATGFDLLGRMSGTLPSVTASAAEW